MHLAGDPASPRLVTVKTGIDHTEGMLEWTKKKMKEIEHEALCGFIFKSRSPSSGIGGVKVYTSSGIPGRKGAGIFGASFTKYFPLTPVIDEGRLHDPKLREEFHEEGICLQTMERVLAEKQFRQDLIHFTPGISS
jgi:uncharacterized protein YbbK (DUF523 family)